MRTTCLLLVGVVVGWAAGGVDWSRDAVGEETDSAPVGAPLLERETSETIELNIEGGAPGLPPVPTDPLTPEASVPKTDKTLVADPAPLQLPPAGRYQISANESGCYRVDTATGRVWHLVPHVKPQVIAGEVDVAE